MGKIYDAPFPQNPVTASPVFKVACAIGTDNAPTNTQLLFTVGLEGGIQTNLWAIPRGVVTAATALYLFIKKPGSDDKILFDSELMPALTTVNGSTKLPKTKFIEYSESSAGRFQPGDQVWGGIGLASAAGIVFFVQESEYDDATA